MTPKRIRVKVDSQCFYCDTKYKVWGGVSVRKILPACKVCRRLLIRNPFLVSNRATVRKILIGKGLREL